MKLGRLTGIAIALLALTVIPNLPQAQAQETAASRITNEEAKTAVDAAEADAERSMAAYKDAYADTQLLAQMLEENKTKVTIYETARQQNSKTT